MTPTPVGMRCPECASQRTRVVRNPTGMPSGLGAYPATKILIAINVIVFLVEVLKNGGGFSIGTETIYEMGGLFGPAIGELGDWWRLITSGFLHVSVFHIGFNMLLLFFMGRLLEPAIGTLRFVVLYFAALLTGSFVALLLSPETLSAGASGAIFGLLGATFVVARGRNMDAVAGEIGLLIVFNLVYSFAVSGISIGAHIGGLAGGVLCGLLIVAGERGHLGQMPRRNRIAIELAVMAAIGILAFVLSLAIAPTPFQT
jgi:membrane associated rhomboid family serine protease